jgi:hypothetical protein
VPSHSISLFCIFVSLHHLIDAGHRKRYKSLGQSNRLDAPRIHQHHRSHFDAGPPCVHHTGGRRTLLLLPRKEGVQPRPYTRLNHNRWKCDRVFQTEVHPSAFDALYMSHLCKQGGVQRLDASSGLNSPVSYCVIQVPYWFLPDVQTLWGPYHAHDYLAQHQYLPSPSRLYGFQGNCMSELVKLNICCAQLPQTRGISKTPAGAV